MAEAATKLPLKTEEKKAEPTSAVREWRPFEALHREIDRLFDDFGGGFWRSPFRRSVFDLGPFWRRELSWETAPAMDIAETEKAYEITAELPGMSESDVEVVASDGGLTIKGEKKEEKEEKEEKKKDYYLSERRYGSFERRMQIPEGVDADKIEATFKKGGAYRDAPEDDAGTKAGEEDLGQSCLRVDPAEYRRSKSFNDLTSCAPLGAT
jgi:HSP20 family protein